MFTRYAFAPIDGTSVDAEYLGKSRSVVGKASAQENFPSDLGRQEQALSRLTIISAMRSSLMSIAARK